MFYRSQRQQCSFSTSEIKGRESDHCIKQLYNRQITNYTELPFWKYSPNILYLFSVVVFFGKVLNNRVVK